MEACLAEGPGGTRLANCVKGYLGPAAAGEPYGIVFAADVTDGRLFLRYLGFGERHPDRGRQSVYEIADRRLHG